MDQSAITSITELAVEAAAAKQLGTDTPSILLRDADGAERVESLEPFDSHRSRFRGTFATAVIDEFAGYIADWSENGNASTQPQAFINADDISATAIFNLGDDSAPGHADHRAVLKLKPTAAYLALTKRPGQFNQRQLADWLEDWRDHLVPLDASGNQTPLPAAIAAVRDVTVEKARTDQHTVRDLGASRSAMESVDAKSVHVLPAAFEFICVPFEGLTSRTLVLRLGVNTGDDKLAFTLRLLQAEAIAEAIAIDFRQVLTDKLGTSCRIRIGQFAP